MTDPVRRVATCAFCPRPDRFAICMCVHEHSVGVWVCGEVVGSLVHAAILEVGADVA